jgi:hypothetical protein
MMTALLGEPDTLGRNPHYAKAALMRLYTLPRVEAAEGSVAFTAAKAKAAGRVAGVSRSTIIDGIAVALFDGLPISASRCL